jgi:cytochrome oxidase Cu insertion factor (SCO1/SenC/PrrC family)
VRFYSDVLEGKTVLINVIYTNCKDACPMITQQLLDVRKRLPEAVQKQVHFVTITSDPKRDTPKALKAFAQKQSADLEGWTFLTGSKDNVDHILKKLGQFSEHLEGHSTLLIGGNVPAKRWSKMRADAPAQAIVARMTELATASGSAPAEAH